MENAKELIKKYSDSYYNDGISLVPDEVFDELVKQVYNDSDMEYVGSPINPNDHPVPHNWYMGSLNKFYDKNALIQYFKNRIGPNDELVVDYKYDGIAVDLEFRNKELYMVSTRGDGFVGADITQQFIFFCDYFDFSLNDHLVNNFNLHGELIIATSEQKRLGVTTNPRNYVSGLVKRKNYWHDTDLKHCLVFCPYNYYSGDLFPEDFVKEKYFDRAIGFQSEQRRNNLLVAATVTKCDKLEETMDVYESLIEEKLFPCDGLVIKVRNLYQTEENKFKGLTGKNPKWSVAYKWKNETTETVLNKISYQVGRTGNVTPVAWFEPVKLNGTIIKKCSLHNDQYIEAMNIKEGDLVEIYKAGEIIPQVLRVIEHRGEPHKPIKTCPECNAVLKQKIDKIDKYCSNLSCSRQSIRSLIHYASKDAMNIKHMGPKVIEKLYELGYLSSIIDFYSLSDADIDQATGSELVTDKIMASIEKSQELSVEHLIYALGIPTIGKTKARILAEHYGNLWKIKAGIADGDVIDGIGPNSTFYLNEWFTNHEELLEDLTDCFVCFRFKYKNGPLDGLNICVTGVLDNDILSRSDAKRLIPDLGGRSQDTVSQSTDILVVGERPSQGKIRTANMHNIQKMNATEFYKLAEVL